MFNKLGDSTNFLGKVGTETAYFLLFFPSIGGISWVFNKLGDGTALKQLISLQWYLGKIFLMTLYTVIRTEPY